MRRRAWIGIGVLVTTAAALTLHLATRSAGGCTLPPLVCTERCDELVWFGPSRGSGYEDEPLDDEVALPHSTSYLRRDLVMAIKYAAAKVACTCGGHPLALGDMSDRDGATPGTAYGEPRHPRNTHVAGRDIDVAYYQRGTPDNHLRPICPHEVDGVEQWHCVAAPNHLDARRTAAFIGALFESPRVRIVGVDGAAAAPILRAVQRACADGSLEPEACARVQLGYETASTGRLWFLGHHNHMHVSWRE